MSPKLMIDALIKKGITKAEIARRLHVDWQTVNHWHMKRFSPSSKNITRLKRVHMKATNDLQQ